MLLTFSVLICGILTLLWSGSALVFHNQWMGESVFPAKSPRWLFVMAWIYLTLAICAWVGVFQKPNALASLAAGIVLLSAVKFIYLVWAYPDFRRVVLLLWNTPLALRVILTSSVLIGVLMLIVAYLLK